LSSDRGEMFSFILARYSYNGGKEEVARYFARGNFPLL